jgi:hypothetical protein
MTRVTFQFCSAQLHCVASFVVDDASLHVGHVILAQFLLPAVRDAAGHERTSFAWVQRFPSADVNHIAAARDVANEQDDKESEQENRRTRASGAEVEVSMNQIDPDADQKYAPSPCLGASQMDKSKKPKWDHPRQSPKAAIRVRSQ